MIFSGEAEIRLMALREAIREGWSWREIMSRTRRQPIAWRRQELMRRAVAAGCSIQAVAKAFRRDWATVQHAVLKGEEE